MSDGFIPVKPKKSRRQQYKKKPRPKPEPQVDEGWGTWNEEADNTAWFQPKSLFGDYKAWDQQERVDRLDEFIPFWRDNMYAAERGEEMKKYADFLDRIYAEEARWTGCTKAHPWGVPEEERRGSVQDKAGWGDAADGGWGKVDDGLWVRVNSSEPVLDEAAKPEGDENGDGWGIKDWEDSYDPWAEGKAACDEWTRALERAGDRSGSGPATRDTDANSILQKAVRKHGVSRSRKKKMQNFYSVST